jgi:PAS domain S-box-containing protein
MSRYLSEQKSAPSLGPAAFVSDSVADGHLNRRFSRPYFPRLTIKAHIIAIVLALAIPLNAVIFAVIWHLSDKADEMQRTSLLYTARSVAAAFDAKLGEYMALAQALARSPAVLEENIAPFEAEARLAFPGPDAWVLIADASGQQLFNMARPPGEPLPVRKFLAQAAQTHAFETRSPVVTGVRQSEVTPDWVINIELPIFKNGQPFRSLAVMVRARSFLHLLNDQQIPKGWLACVIDHEGRFVARVPGHERNVGQLAAEGLRKVKDQDGISEFSSLEGDRIVAANAHSAMSGWPVAIAVKKAEFQAATWSAIRWAAIFGACLSSLSLVFAAAIARRITGPIAALRNKVDALLKDPASVYAPAGPPEVDHLWTAIKQSAAALRESEERFRGIFEHAGTGIAILGLDGRFQSCNPSFSNMLGYSEQELRGLAFPSLVHPDDRHANLIENSRLISEQIPSFEIINRIRHRDGKTIWVHKYISLLRDAAGEPNSIIALVTDMTGRKHHEDRINLLIQEVNHRSKNMLAVVQAVARQTLAAKPEEFVERFEQRIHALSASQNLLAKSEWKGVDLGELGRSQLQHFADLIDSRIKLNGPRLLISAKAAQAIGMALHELATNAGKYGALSNAYGRVAIGWDLKPHDESDDTFTMIWHEQDGPSIGPPAKAGFGSTVLCRATKESLDAEIELDYSPAGLVWRLQCPGRNVLEVGEFF